MLMQRIMPSFPFEGFHDEVERLFDDFATPIAGGVGRRRTFPAVNLWEDAECIFAEAELPGLSMDDVEVAVIGNELSIKGQRMAGDDGDWTYHRRERGTGEFSRFFSLPVDVDAGRVEAVLKNGVLTVKLPKVPAAKPRKIEVKAG